MHILKYLMAALILLSSLHTTAGDYQQPSAPLQQVLEQTKMVDTRLAGDARHIALLHPQAHPTIHELAQSEKKLAGLRISPDNLAQSRPKKRYQFITLINLDNNQRLTIQQQGANIANVQFSPDSQYLSYIAITPRAVDLYLYQLASGQTQRLNASPLNAVFGAKYQWQHDSKAIVTTFAVPQDKQAPFANIGPNISHALGEKAPRRTYQDLIQNQQDEQAFKQLTTSQLAIISLDGQRTNVGQPQINSHFALSPNDQFLIAKQIHAPYSYIVKYYDFSQQVELFNRDGQHIKTLGHIDSGEFRAAGADSVSTGPRLIHWRPDQPDTLVFVQPLDNGDGEQPAALRDEVLNWPAPFTQIPHALLQMPWRINDLDWAEQGRLFVSEKNANKKQVRVSILDVSLLGTDEAKPAKLWYQKAQRDTYKAPGRLYRDRQQGVALVDITQGKFSHYGIGASAKGYRPFLKQTQLDNNYSETIWQSASDKLEQVKYVISLSPLKLIIKREDSITPPHLVLVEPHTGSEQLLYQADNELAAYQGMTRQLVNYQRADGLPLSGMLYLPAGYDKSQGPLPLLMWAYPREYKDAKVAAQVNYSVHQYQGISAKGPLPFVAQGFAVFDKVAMPIVGQGDIQPNDSFRTQLVANAKAAIDTLSDMGIADPNRVAIGGHSYGAFMVANLLAHSDLFKAGIARSGAYNRSLTPFGFQYEKRNYWEAPALYQQMSPFTHADKIDEPLLLIHGEMDANSGTYPMQSSRLFNAIRGLGGTAKLVMLPYESHSYAAKESLQHMLWEQQQWLEQYVKPINADIGKAHSAEAPESIESLE